MTYPIQSSINQSTKEIQTRLWTEFFDSLKQQHQLLAMTIVFKPIDRNNSTERWETEYTSGVLKKIRRAIEPNPANQDSALPIPDFFYFERFKSTGLRNAGRRSPYHIHSLLPIRMTQIHRIWSHDSNTLKHRVLKDIMSLGTVQSLLVEPVRDGCTVDWIRYITKQKQI